MKGLEMPVTSVQAGEKEPTLLGPASRKLSSSFRKHLRICLGVLRTRDDQSQIQLSFSRKLLDRTESDPSVV